MEDPRADAHQVSSHMQQQQQQVVDQLHCTQCEDPAAHHPAWKEQSYAGSPHAPQQGHILLACADHIEVGQTYMDIMQGSCIYAGAILRTVTGKSKRPRTARPSRT